MSETLTDPVGPSSSLDQPRPVAIRPAPVAPGERILLLDILRGFAVFGILVVNILYFSGPLEWVVAPRWTEVWNRVANALITILFAGKFYSIFSILFGIGFAVQMIRSEERGLPLAGRYLRRLFVLFIIGIVHASLIWYGDILHTYAFLGVFLLVFRRIQKELLLVLAFLSALVPVALFALGALAMSFAPDGALAGQPETLGEAFGTAESLRVYATGSWSEVTAQRIRDWVQLAGYSLFFMPSIFAMFLVGLWAGRSGVLRDLTARRPLFKRLLMITLPIGLAGNVAVYVLRSMADPMLPTWTGALSQLAYSIGVPFLALAYIAAIALMVAGGSAAFSALAPVGRMALTNYLLHSIVCTLIFYSYGLGFYGQVGPWIAIPMALVIFILQIPLSAWWLGRFRFGPVEWLWRTATYGKAQPMKIERASVPSF
ncbi:MAG TPA: DUF418 domain-containing protein [Thermoanaerobaculia bacterium]|nr:DUF418 domain-containing protein [Thermoanaerobaculia bacterium]